MERNQIPQSEGQPFDHATEIVCQRTLHQVFWLPENDIHERLRVTYATTTDFTDPTLPVVLICPPMFGSRWMLLHFNQLAKTTGVRIICFDRLVPSMGGSSPVSPEHRVKVWLETVPALLNHLGVKHVSLLSHSAGTIYALNTLYYLRDILDPDRPYVALIAPWVSNEHSNAALMNWASKVPGPLLDSWHNVIKFVGSTVQPAMAWSGGISSSVAGLFQKSDTSQSDAALAAKYGTVVEVAKEIERLATKYFFAEDVRAGTEEAKLCLRKGRPDSWLACSDYKKYVQDLLAREDEIAKSGLGNQNLKMRVFYAASDIMIGEGGKAYFEELWKTPEVKQTIDFDSKTLPETDHDSTLIDLDKGAVRRILEEIKAASQGSNDSI